jgi:hypothetical protein
MYGSDRFRNYRPLNTDTGLICYRPDDNDYLTLPSGEDNTKLRSNRHALLVIGYRKVKIPLSSDEETHIEVKNSWGPSWGQGGYAWIKMSDPPAMGIGAEVHWIEKIN